MGHVTVVGGCRAKAPSTGILASALPVGSVVKLMENGVATEYLVVNQGKPSGSSLYDDSCDGTWLLRKNAKESRQWHSSNVNDYQNSTIHNYLNSIFLNMFDDNIIDLIKSVKIPYVNGTGGSSIASGSNGLSTKVFLLSGYEVGWTTSSNQYFPVDGAVLSYFSGTAITDSKRIAYMNGSVCPWWSLRSALSNSTAHIFYVDANGFHDYAYCTDSCFIRPALVLPSNALFSNTTLILKGVA